MKLLRRNPAKFETMDLFRALSRDQGYKLTDADSSERFVQKLSEEFSKARGNPIVLHGLRTQAMFEYVAASLGKCVAVKSEDAGSIHVEDTEVEIPDLRILLHDGQELFAEVKNFYQKDPSDGYEAKRDYLHRLRRYSALFKRDTKLAIYWVRWNIWTMTPIDVMQCENNKCTLSLEEAMKHNQMSVLGDYMVGTVPPLRSRVITDPTRPRHVDEDGQVVFAIGGIELHCGDTRITKPLEHRIALFLMMYGDWPGEEGETEIRDDELIAFEFVVEPIRLDVQQGFQLIGSMSGMISRRFDSLTSGEGTIERLSPSTDSSNLGITIPEDYEGQALPLWRFHQAITE